MARIKAQAFCLTPTTAAAATAATTTTTTVETFRIALSYIANRWRSGCFLPAHTHCSPGGPALKAFAIKQ